MTNDGALAQEIDESGIARAENVLVRSAEAGRAGAPHDAGGDCD